MRLVGRAPKCLAAGSRLIGCAVALSAMLGQMGSYAHLAFTAHVQCAEHGELIEAGAVSKVAVTHPRSVAERDYVAQSGDATHGHEHCLVAPHRRDRATHTFARTLVATAQLPFVARIVEAVGPPRAI
ncbi:MAG: hypothetical protein JWM53_5244, partial [bacterium]|nr:hypothetical protein [bacterium]